MTEPAATPSPRPAALRDLFDRAVELPPETRAAFVTRACAGDPPLRAALEELLSAHDRAGDFLSAAEISPAAIPAERFAPGARIGPYTLLKVIGEGGYGTVYLAEQAPPLPRRVALKVIKAGMDTRQIIARFELERQALARMDHPHIARVLDAGATDTGRPYFVMELVDGRPLTDFARERRLSLADRLALFLDVCSAVQHAHQKGIIHRDLKPANVLVTLRDHKPLAKIIDFGIAKALRTAGESDLHATLTQVPQFLGTPQYMSPEQAAAPAGDIDARTDIYALGVLLYELLTGSPPFDRDQLRAVGYGEIHRLLREVDPPIPSAKLLKLSQTLLAGSPSHAREVKQLAHHIRGELDWITMKAMEKDRTRRYDSVEAFAADIQRFLHDQPIAAGPPNAAYRLRKFLRRRRSLVALALAVLLLLIASAIALPRASRPAHSAPPPAQSSTASGVIARIYAGTRFETIITSRVVPQINFSWPRGTAPAPGITPPHYAIRFEGILRIPPGGAEQIGFNADDGGRLTIDGTELLQAQHPGERLAAIPLSPGPHPFTLEYWNRIAEGHITFLWKLPGAAETAIPPTALSHTP